MFKKMCILAFLSMLLVAEPSYSEEKITWEKCVHITIESNPELIAASEKVKQAKKDKDINLSPILPQVDSEASSRRGRASSGKTKNTHSYSVTGQQLVFDGFKTASEVSSAYKTIQAEEYNYTVTSSNVRLNLRNAFVGLMRAEELVNITENIARRRRQNLELIKLRYEGGLKWDRFIFSLTEQPCQHTIS